MTMSSTRPVIEFAGRKIAVDAPHLVFATGIAGWIAWLCRDAWHSSPTVENLILIVPVSAAACLFYLFVAAGCFQLAGVAEDREPSSRKPLAGGVGVKITGSMALLAGLVVAGPLIGFDVACFVYLLATMAFLGERRIIVLLLVPLVFCVAVIYCFSTLLATPLPLFFFRGYGA